MEQPEYIDPCVNYNKLSVMEKELIMEMEIYNMAEYKNCASIFDMDDESYYRLELEMVEWLNEQQCIYFDDNINKINHDNGHFEYKKK